MLKKCPLSFGKLKYNCVFSNYYICIFLQTQFLIRKGYPLGSELQFCYFEISFSFSAYSCITSISLPSVPFDILYFPQDCGF